MREPNWMLVSVVVLGSLPSYSQAYGKVHTMCVIAHPMMQEGREMAHGTSPVLSPLCRSCSF